MRASVDLRKLSDYCLDPLHPRGRHKARVFRDALDLGREDAAWLREIFLKQLGGSEAVEVAKDKFGARWRVDMPVERHGRRAVVRTVWILRTGEDEFRLLTCWVL
jgi:hypothetical protein